MRARWELSIVVASIILLTRVATADDALPSLEPEKRESSGKQTEVLPEIVVTATRRNEEESKVPISIVALDQAALTTSGLKTISDIANYALRREIPQKPRRYIPAGPLPVDFQKTLTSIQR